MIPFEIVPVPEAVAERVRRSRQDDWGNVDLTPVVADSKPGFPCRVCLRDAEPGEEMLLFSYSPFERATPQRTVGPIYIHAKRCQPWSDDGVVPEQLRRRLLSLRSFDEHDQMLDVAVVEGRELEDQVARLFEEPRARIIHVHNARPGCLACLIRRR
jgi:hypothetical protein